MTVGFDHRGRDHRVRVHLPLPEPATTSRAGCAFGLVERGLNAEGGPTEVGLPHFPARGFVTAGGLTVAHEGVLEYELVDLDDDGANTLALTVLRATGFLSRGPMATRPLPAGPLLATAGSQVPGARRLSLAISARPCDPYELAEDAFVPLLVADGAGLGTYPAVHQALAVRGARVSSVRRTAHGDLEVRVFNPTDQPTRVELGGRRGALVDLRGERLADGDIGADGFDLRPWGIATAVLEPF